MRDGSAVEYQDRYIELFKDALCASLYDESGWRRIEGPMRQHVRGNPIKAAKRAVIRAFLAAAAKRGVILVRTYPFVAEHRLKGIDWPLFGYTQTGRLRLDCLQRCIETVLRDDVPGDIVETGVWRGGSMMLAAAMLDAAGDRRKVWCCDSYEGMPVPTIDDQSFSGTEDFSDLDYINVGLEQVKANFRRFGVLSDRVEFLKGWFCDTLPTAPIEQISILRLDGDLYESTRDALDPLYPKVSKGGFVIVDDYGSWPGCKQAVTEYRARNGITAPIVPIDNAAIYWKVQ